MTRANLQLTDYDAEGRPRVEDLELVSASLSAVLTMELDGAAGVLELTTDEILLAALGRAIERTIGTGVVDVDVPCYGTSVQPVELSCAAPAQLHADEMLAGVHHELDAVAALRVVHGVPDDPRAETRSAVLFATGRAPANGRTSATSSSCAPTAVVTSSPWTGGSTPEASRRTPSPSWPTSSHSR